MKTNKSGLPGQSLAIAESSGQPLPPLFWPVAEFRFINADTVSARLTNSAGLQKQKAPDENCPGL